MNKKWLARLFAGFMLALAVPAMAADGEHPSVKRRFKLPPSAELTYAVKLAQKGLPLKGDALLNWKVSGGRYLVFSETRSQLLGKVMESRSEGVIDSFGLAPAKLTEKRMRKPPYGATFDREEKIICLTQSDITYPIKGGEQDRTSILIQLIAVARGAPQKFATGSEWKFFVVGRKNAEAWTFRVVGREKIRTVLGEMAVVRVTRLQPAESREQQLDLWLAPSLEWFPVRMRFHDADGTQSEQELKGIQRQ